MIFFVTFWPPKPVCPLIKKGKQFVEKKNLYMVAGISESTLVVIPFTLHYPGASLAVTYAQIKTALCCQTRLFVPTYPSWVTCDGSLHARLVSVWHIPLPTVFDDDWIQMCFTVQTLSTVSLYTTFHMLKSTHSCWHSELSLGSIGWCKLAIIQRLLRILTN